MGFPPPSKFMSATAASTSPRVVKSFMIACREIRLRPVPRNLSQATAGIDSKQSAE